tara:strand:+ start:173 stop:364 length:192 start_codon:yes stop_codon:yes gene_type:complete
MNLKQILKERGITVIFLSERMGLSRPTLYKYIDNPKEFKVKHLLKIAKYLELSEREALINYFI